MTEITFAFGRHGIAVRVPEPYKSQVIETRASVALVNVSAAIEDSLQHPIQSPPLVELARGTKTAAISVCDITRPAPNKITLPPLLDSLHEGGIPVEGITFLIATGLHRQATEEEVKAILGSEIASKYRVINHDARDSAVHRSLGLTSRGTPVFIDDRFLSADLHITVGMIEPHLMLGFSGCRKMIAPGIAAQETIKEIHSPKFMQEVNTTEGSIEDNPLHAELLEIAHMARHDFILDVTLTKEREISGIFAGSPVAAHAEGVKFLRTNLLERLSGLADVVITSAAGYPLDLTFYQTIKGVTAAQHIVRPGGKILVLGECAEGIGSREFAEAIRQFTIPHSFLESVRQKEVSVDQWQIEKLALVALKHDIYFFVPGILPEQIGAFANRCYERLDDAIAAVLQGQPSSARVALVPEGPYVFARVAN